MVIDFVCLNNMNVKTVQQNTSSKCTKDNAELVIQIQLLKELLCCILLLTLITKVS